MANGHYTKHALKPRWALAEYRGFADRQYAAAQVVGYRLRGSGDVNVVIYGPPGCGKTTYANEIRTDGDIVFDLDLIAAALNPSFEKYKERPNDIAWLILGFRDLLIRKHQHGMLSDRKIIVIVEREDQARSVARKLRAELVRPR